MSNLIKKTGSPQGKGIVGIVEDLRCFAPIQVQAKNNLQWLADYFTSTLVLGAQYGFKPIVGKPYYLYFKDKEWKLSLIEPQAWNSHNPGTFFAECVLSNDMTWSVVLESNWQEDSNLVKTVSKLEKIFIESLSSTASVVEQLPFCLSGLKYYQRLGAHVLACSLQTSLELELGKERSKNVSGAKLLSDFYSKNSLLLDHVTG